MTELLPLWEWLVTLDLDYLDLMRQLLEKAFQRFVCSVVARGIKWLKVKIQNRRNR